MEWLKQSLTGNLTGWSVAVVTDKGLSKRFPIAGDDVLLDPLAGNFAYEAVFFDANGIERYRAPLRTTGQTFKLSTITVDGV